MMQTAINTTAFKPGEAVLIPANVIRPASDQAGGWGAALIDTGWSRYTLDFIGDAVVAGLVRGTIEGRSHAGHGKWDVRVNNNLADAIITMPADLIQAALQPERRAA